MIRATRSAGVSPRARLSLLREFQLLIGNRSIAVPHGVQRLLALLAVGGHPMTRSRVAGQLWPDVPEWRALGNLRSALWRLRRIPATIVRTFDERISLDPEVEVDLEELIELSVRMLADPDKVVLGRLSQLVQATEVLPDWGDEWLIVERERFRELRLHALERACESLLDMDDAPSALDAALAAVEAEPFRESAQRLLVRVHLSEGNRADALRAYLAYRDLVHRELGIEPSDLMEALVAPLPHRSGVATTRP